ncbi:MAG: hypothetical protein IPL72_18060 [Sulfuritalea sp.]|nr:hypothetical protein [Sulfuritalea sp.]
MDATSDIDLGERFDMVFADVVEHVDNVVRLLQFAARHGARQERLCINDAQPVFAQVLPPAQARRGDGGGTSTTSRITPTQAMGWPVAPASRWRPTT